MPQILFRLQASMTALTYSGCSILIRTDILQDIRKKYTYTVCAGWLYGQGTLRGWVILGISQIINETSLINFLIGKKYTHGFN